jgi:hypothetical protein
MDHWVSAVCVFVAVFEMGCKAFLQDGVHVDADFGLLAPYAGGGRLLWVSWICAQPVVEAGDMSRKVF